MPKMPTKVVLSHSNQTKLEHYENYEQDQHNTINTFINDRFEFYIDDQNNSVISGSTFSHPKVAKSEKVLDASVTDFIYDADGVRIGFAMATGDGLGHFVEDLENVSTGLVTVHACEKLVIAAKNHNGKIPAQAIPKLFHESGQGSKHSRLRYGVKNPHAKEGGTQYDSESAHSFVSVTVENGKPSGSVGNVGDGMVIIIDGHTMKVKHILPAVNYARFGFKGAIEWTPQAIQNLDDKTLHHVDHHTIPNLSEDDLVIQMTDGAWSEFSTTSKVVKDENGNLRREISINPTAIEQLLVEVLADLPFSCLPTHIIGQTLLQAIAKNALQKRAIHMTLLKRLAPHIESATSKKFTTTTAYESFTISVWVDEIRQSDNQLAEDFLNYFANQQEDVIYKLECPALMFLQRIQQKSFGDCCTIAIMRVPNQKLELVRALVENPQNRYQLLPRIQAISETELDDLYDRLSSEIFIRRSHPITQPKDAVKGKRLLEIPSAIKLSYPLDKNQIQDARKTIQAYKVHLEWLKVMQNSSDEFIKSTCKNGEDQKKFVEFMLLGLDHNHKDPNQKGLSALALAVKNNRPAIVKFIIEHAMQNVRTQELLAMQLLEKSIVGKNVLHEAVSIPDNAPMITMLCEVAKFLYMEGVATLDAGALGSFVNSKDNNHGNSALHICVSEANFSNYQALITAKADATVKAHNGAVAFELLRYGHHHARTAIFMKNWILHTDEGQNYLITRYGCDPQELPAPFLDDLIKVELDLMIKDPHAQLSGLRMALRLIASADAKIGKTLSVSLTAINYVNFESFSAENLVGDPSQAILKQALQSAATIRKFELKRLFIKAEILRQHKEYPQANRAAFDLYSTEELLSEYPRLCLDGILALNRRLLDESVQAKQIVVAMTYIALAEMKNIPQTSGFNSILVSKNKAPTILKKFLKEMQSVTDIEEVITKINALPKNGYIDRFKQSTLTILSQTKLYNGKISPAVKPPAGSK